jgi:hypothetical protein
MFLILMAAALAAAPRSAPPVITPNVVARMIDTYGSKGAVDRLAKPNHRHPMFGDYEVVLDGVSSGAAQWLALVPRLKKGTDAGTSEFLKISVAEALPHNAAGVLRLGARGWPMADACSYPMLEPTRAQTRKYFAAAIPAVEAVHDPALQTAKATCLSELRTARKTVSR